jgi:uncharacterized RDD family membrane protein YckC
VAAAGVAVFLAQPIPEISKAAMAMKITDLLSILVTLVFCLAVFNGIYSNREILRYY